jgi:Uma2 family endonuclease
VKKRADYAEAGIREYWLADTVAETFTVLTLRDGQYAEHGVYRRGDTVASPGFEGLVVDVSSVLDAD